jgi:hypothetical protein
VIRRIPAVSHRAGGGCPVAVAVARGSPVTRVLLIRTRILALTARTAARTGRQRRRFGQWAGRTALVKIENGV